MQKQLKENMNSFPWEIIKKIILLVVIISMGIYVVCHSDKFWVDKSCYVDHSPDSGTINLTEVKEVDQEFVASDPTLNAVEIVFSTANKYENSGKIKVVLKDDDNNILATDTCSAKKLVQKKDNKKTAFQTASELKVGEIYHIVINSKGLSSKDGIYLLLSTKKGNLYHTLTVDGAEQNTRVKMSFDVKHYDKYSFLFILLILFIALIFICIPMDYLQKKMDKIHQGIEVNRWISRIFFVASPVVSFFIVQRYCGYDLRTFLKTFVSYRGMVNILIYLLIFLLIYIVTNRTKYTAVLMIAFTSVLGLANHFVWEFRGTPIMMADLASVKTAGQVADGYSYSLDLSGMYGVALTLAFICIVLSLKDYRGLPWKIRICTSLLLLIPLGFVSRSFLDNKNLKGRGLVLQLWNPSDNYAKLGCMLSFYISYSYYKVEKPDNYSAEEAKKITSDYESDASNGGGEKNTPNVIAIMNESLSDLNYVGDAETSEDVMPFLHNLKKNTIKGKLYMSVFGGNTCNSEFEFLTGCSMAFFPYRSIPYNNYIHGEFPTITQNMELAGYSGNLAFHPGTATAWSRDVVYPYFGFEKFYTKKDMGSNLEMVRNRISDQSDYEYVIQKYEETRKSTKDPFYIFNVTIQNHGGYDVKNTRGLDMDISFKNESYNQYSSALQYESLVKASDDAFKDLVEYFSNVDEPTVIVMFGDHLPKLPDKFFEGLLGKTSDQFALEDIMKEYAVPYVIWCNYDIREENVDMSANYLSAFLMQSIGGNMTAYQKWLMNLREELPVITANAYQGKDGVWHAIDEESEYSDLIHQYQIVQYNNVMDTKNRNNAIYYLQE